jgi:hypothetical protein
MWDGECDCPAMKRSENLTKIFLSTDSEGMTANQYNADPWRVLAEMGTLRYFLANWVELTVSLR